MTEANPLKNSEIGNLPSSWDIVSVEEIKDIGKSVISGPFGSNISSKFFVKSGVPVIRGNNLSLAIGTRFIDKDFVFITEEKAKELGTWASEDDLIFTAVGTIGQVGLLSNKSKYNKYIISNKQLRLTVDKNMIEPLFAYYWFSTPYMREHIISNNTGSSVPLINLGILKSLLIPLPPLNEQRAITAVISNFDDKIDLLQRQNATLEAMAEALFKQWFVVEAKEEWEEKKLSDMVNLVGGGTPKTSMPNYWGGTIPWLSGGDIACHHKTFIFSSEKFITDDGLNNSAARLVPKYTTIITARGTVGKFCLTGKPMAFSQTNYGVMPKDNKNFFFTFLLIDYVVNTLKSAAYGSVFDTITSQLFDEVSIALPSKNVIEKFDSTVGVFFEKIFSNQKQIQTLQKLRDTLLPKLMSGEVRVALD